MAVDFQQVRKQVKELGASAKARLDTIIERRNHADQLLDQHATNFEQINHKVDHARRCDRTLRCAAPLDPRWGLPEALNVSFPLPELPPRLTLLAADGSQIIPSRHEEVQYALINVGAIQMTIGEPDGPRLSVISRLLFDDALFTETGMLTESGLNLQRDLAERNRLAELAIDIPSPLVTFTDGPLELWGAKEGESGDYRNALEAFQEALRRLHSLGAITAGYVDRPGANLLVRLLEVTLLSETELVEIRYHHPLRGVSDFSLLGKRLGPGERSALYTLRSGSSDLYHEELSLHFFYLNVSSTDHPYLARVELPAWVVANPSMLDHLHAALVQQCRILGGHPYPYLLHRAHEVAVVSLEEKEQVSQMIIHELIERGIPVDQISHKQFLKIQPKRTSVKP